MATSQVPSTALTIQIARAALCYAGRDIAKKAFRSNPINDNLKLQLWVASEVLDWTNTYNSSNADLISMRNYTLALAGQYIVEAVTSIGEGGQVIVPTIAPTFNWRWVTNSFTVGSAGAPVLNGQSTFTITEDNIAQDSVAFGFSNASPFPRTGTVPTGQQTYTVSYTPTAITITTAAPLLDGEQYTLTYVRFGGTQAFTGGGASLPTQTGHEGQVLFTDGTNTYWADVIIDNVSADFESDGITVNDTRMVHNQLDIYWNEGGRFLDPATEFTRILSGGYTINITGFDATTQTVTMKVILRGLNS